jgi:uncharacterized protein (TIGR03435 family)
METRQLPIFAVVLVKLGRTGPQLRPHSEGPPCDDHVAEVFPPACGALRAEKPPDMPGGIRIGARDVTMSQIATWLDSPITGASDRPAVDQTGLNGKFDFTLSWVRPARGPSSTTQPDSSGPTFLEAVREQLGLKLETATGSVNTFVVDHIEEPSPN